MVSREGGREAVLIIISPYYFHDILIDEYTDII
jgi:hypothetical protein